MSNRAKRNVSQPQCYRQFNQEGRTETGSPDSEVLLSIQDQHQHNHDIEAHLSLQQEINMAEAQHGNPSDNGSDDQQTMITSAQVHADRSGDNFSGHASTQDDASDKDEVEIHAPTDNEDFEHDYEHGAYKTPTRQQRHTGKSARSVKLNKQFQQILTDRSTNDSFTISDLEQARQENRKAKELLAQQEIEAQILAEKLETEERKCKAIKLQQQINRQQKKVQQEKVRYDKEIKKIGKTNEQNKEIIIDKREPPTANAKKQLDSWLQTQRNMSTGRWQHESDTSDDETGPKKMIPSIENVGSVYNIAKDLINDEKLSICRDTGIMKKRSSSPAASRRSRDPPRHARNDHRSDRSSSGWSSTSRQHRSPERCEKRRDGSKKYDKEEPWSREMRRAFSPSREKERAGGSDRSWFSGDTDSTSSDDMNKQKRRKRRNEKSGINAKPCSKVKKELTYPHFSLGQLSGFMGVPISYHVLSYEQFVAGEMCTIMNTSCATERRGRVTLLQKVTNWKLMVNASWTQIRNTYAHVLRKIENDEIDWGYDFDRFEKHIFDKVAIRPEKTERPIRKVTSPQQDWFCKQYQKVDGCPKDSPHTTMVGNRVKTVQHFCAACWLVDRKTKKWHPECSPDCPLKEI